MTTLKLEGKGDMIQIHCIIVWNSLPVALIHPKKTMILCQITVSKLNTTTNKTVKVTSNQTTHSCLKKKNNNKILRESQRLKKYNGRSSSFDVCRWLLLVIKHLIHWCFYDNFNLFNNINLCMHMKHFLSSPPITSNSSPITLPRHYPLLCSFLMHSDST